MLHEILLSLSGHPSPLFELSAAEESRGSQESFLLLSPPEKALLSPIAHLSKLHKSLQVHTARISSSHPSTVCRAVSTALSTEHLGAFQRKIIDVERLILGKDAGYVGGYGIVPLSTIVGEFSPWVRRMEWLWETAQFMQPATADNKNTRASRATGAALIDYLRMEAQTGYVDVEEMALTLTAAAETAWMRQLSVFILYGHIPPLGQQDFFIQELMSGDNKQSVPGSNFILRTELLPKFISSSTATSILFIGKSLNHIRARGKFPAGEEAKISSSHMTLHGDYIRRLSSLSSPISTVSLANAVSDIRLSLSQTALSQLLPLHKIMEILSLMHNFLLLGRGEFAMALVSLADKRIVSKSKRISNAKSGDGKLPGFDFLSLKESDISAVLTQVWAELYSLQNAEDPVDDELDLARTILRLFLCNDNSNPKGITAAQLPQTNLSDTVFDDLLFGSPTTLSLRVHSPLDLFLAQSDLMIYSNIHSYLLSIRRAQIRLGDLWKRTPLRRVHPAPWGPPLSNKPAGRENLRLGRERQKRRAAMMRPVWAAGSATLFVLSELGSYLQGEVIGSSWRSFREWLDSGYMPSSGYGSRPGTASSAPNKENKQSSPTSHDPETITIAHRIYLAHLSQALFLTDVPFTRTLRAFLTHVDHFISLLGQLQAIQQNLDLETDEGVFDSSQNYTQDEARVWSEICNVRTALKISMNELISRLRDIDEHRITKAGTFGPKDSIANVHDDGRGNDMLDTKRSSSVYTPWRSVGVDRLLMRLEFGGASPERNLEYDSGNFIE
ncbi:hypothetical protein FQN57_000729 [Myotisia sp. PD_48]|nr:hypothetical protein FQN57_000729 [Myotisia sp. PD_48]